MFTFLDEQFLGAVVHNGVGGVVRGHHAVVGLGASVSVTNWNKIESRRPLAWSSQFRHLYVFVVTLASAHKVSRRSPR